MVRTVGIFVPLMLGAFVAACGGSGNAEPPASSRPAAHEATRPAGGDPRAAIFVSKGCPQCHSISALGIKSAAEVGPDLTNAAEDVRTRFGVDLAEFFANPTGTMQVVLSTTIQLTPAERDSIIHILKQLHEEHEGGR